MNELKAEKKEFIRNTSWVFVAKAFPYASNLLQAVILARVLGLEGFGLLSLVVTYVGVVNCLLDLRVWESVVKYVGEFLEKNESDHALSMIKFSYLVDFSTGLIVFLVSISLANLANDIFIKSPEGFELVLIFSFSQLVVTVNSTSEALFRVFEKFKTIVFVKLSASIFKLVSILIVLYLGYGVKGVLFAYSAVSFFNLILTQILINRTLRDMGLGNWFSSRIGLLSNRMKEITWFLLNTSLDATLTIASEGRIAVLVLGYFFDSGAAGLYKIARYVINAIGKITEPFHEVIFPKLVSLSTLNLYKRLVEMIKFSVTSLFKFIVPALIVVFFFTEQIISLIFGEQYVTAADTMRILSVAVLFTGSTFWLTPFLLAIGRPGLRTVINTFKVLTYVALLMVLVPKHSYFGAGIAYLVVEVLHFLAVVYLASRLNRAHLA